MGLGLGGGNRLVYPNMRIRDRVVALETDLEIDARRIADFARAAIAKGRPGMG